MGRRFEKNIYQRRILSCMARKHMKRCLVSSVNMKMQIKTKFLYHCMSMAKIKQTNQAPWKKSYDQPESESHSVVSDSLRPHQARMLEWVAFPFSRGSSNTGIEPRSPALQVNSLPAEPPGKPKNTGVGSLSLLQGTFRPRDQTRVSCIAGRYFTN